MDDGPFSGVPVQRMPERSPDQIYHLGDSYLEVHNSNIQGTAPIVTMRDKDSQIKWSIYAVGQNGTKVKSIEFIEHRTLYDTIVRGQVNWTYGHEISKWYIKRDGTLKEYWFSW